MKRVLCFLMASILAFSYFSITVNAVPSEQSTANYLMEYVGRFMERRTQPLVNEPTRAVAPIVVDSTNSVSRFVSDSEIRESQAIFSYEVETAEELSSWRDLFVLRWGGYTHFDIELTLLSYNIGTDNAVLLVSEFTRLHFAEYETLNMDFTAWRYNRIFVFERDASDWVFVRQVIIKDSPISPPNEPVGATRDEIMSWMITSKIPFLDSPQQLRHCA